MLLRAAQARCRRVAELEKLLQLEPENRTYRTTYANASVGLGEHERALRLYRELLSDAPRAQASDLHLSVAHSLKTLGRQQEAIEAYRAAAAARPNFGDAYWSLANLKTYRFTEDEIARMRAEEAAPATALVDRYHLCFALGKAFEDRGEYAESFRYYERGNALKKSQSRYRPESIERNTRLQKTICTREFFARAAGDRVRRIPIRFSSSGCPVPAPRCSSRSSLRTRQVEGTHGLADIPRMVLELQGREPDHDNPRYPRVLAGAAARRISCARRKISRRHARLPHRQAVLHRQDAE